MHLADLARYIEWSWQTYDDGRMQLRFDENESQVVTNWQQQLVFRSYLITSVTRLETMLQATKSQLPNFLKAKPIKNCSMQISYKCVGYSVRLYSSHAATLAMSFKSPACSASACPLRSCQPLQSMPQTALLCCNLNQKVDADSKTFHMLYHMFQKMLKQFETCSNLCP